MRILYVNPVGSGELDGYYAEQLEGAAGADVTVDSTHLSLEGDQASLFLLQEPVYATALYETLRTAQNQGYDGATIDSAAPVAA